MSEKAQEAGILRVAHLGLRVRDLDRSRRFYEGLGFELVVGPVGPEPVAILHHPGGVELNLILNSHDSEDTNVLMDQPHKHAGWTHIALEVASLEDSMACVEAMGHPITEGPLDFGLGWRSAWVRDPDRNVIEFTQRVS